MFATALGSFEMIHGVLLRFEDGEFVILVAVSAFPFSQAYQLPFNYHSFGSFEMIHGVLLRFEDGEFVILVGP